MPKYIQVTELSGENVGVLLVRGSEEENRQALKVAAEAHLDLAVTHIPELRLEDIRHGRSMEVLLEVGDGVSFSGGITVELTETWVY